MPSIPKMKKIRLPQLRGDQSVCVDCGKITNDEEMQNPTAWDKWGDPHCTACIGVK